MEGSLRKRLEGMGIQELEQLRDSPGMGERMRAQIRDALAAKRGISGPEEPDWIPQHIEPIQITVPWSCLAPDNFRRAPLGKSNKAKRARYQRALAAFRDEAAQQYSGGHLDSPAHVDVALYLPNLKVRDVPNYWKCIADGLKEIVLKDDSWRYLADARIRVAGIDRINPRAVITIVDVQSAPVPAMLRT